MFGDECIDALVATSIVVDLDGTAVDAKMNASLLSCVIIVNIENIGIAPSSVHMRLLASHAHKS